MKIRGNLRRKLLWWVLVSVLLVVGLKLAFLSLQKALEKSERSECQTWEDQANHYVKFYATDWQIDQCKHYGIDLSGNGFRYPILP